VGQKLRNDYLILGASLALLAVGWGLDQFWALVAAAAIGFALALALVIQAIRHREFGSDALALLAIVASALVEEWLAAAVITVMLATGRSLERWAQGRANGRLAALLDRAPRFAHVVDASDRVSDVALAQVAVGSRILVRSGEIVPLDGQALSYLARSTLATRWRRAWSMPAARLS
jgi:cation transport ATPase